MGKSRKPAKILEMTGAFKKDPQRRREDPDPNGDIGEPPEDFTEEQAQAWQEIIENHYDGILCKAHRHSVEYTAKLLAFSRSKDPDTGLPLFPVPDKELRIALGALGMDPVNCSKLGIKPKDKPKGGGFTRLK